jgi:hypothetical protein
MTGSRIAMLLALLGLAVATIGLGCSDFQTPQVSVSAAEAAAPSETEITAAIWQLIDPMLKSDGLAPIETVTVYKIGRDADGRWIARAYLTPPPPASYRPSKIIVAKTPAGWETISLTVDETFGGSATSISK